MGIAPYKTFTFDGESSADYGVYITGTGVFNAPERTVELIEIPNRNGAYALDKGRFENIEVTYNVGIVDDSESDFADRVAAFRNWLCSKVGYCRLEDEYNPDEYRMALFSSGIEFDHDLLIAGEAEITFNCKPQRWLKSGETAVTVADGGTLDNPTLFEASPLLQVKGYGSISINGNGINVDNVPIGDKTVSVVPSSKNGVLSYNATVDDSLFKIGDSVTLSGEAVVLTFTSQGAYQFTNGYATNPINCTVNGSSATRNSVTVAITIPQFAFTIGTSSSATVSKVDLAWSLDNGGGSGSSTISIATAYDGNGGLSYNITNSGSLSHITFSANTTSGSVSGYSTKTITDEINIDLDIGEVWIEVGSVITTLNDVAQLPVDLPKLSSGTNTINYDNTFTQVDIVPRWWRV